MATQAENSKKLTEQEKLVTMPQSKSSMATNISQTTEKYQTRGTMSLQKDQQPQLELLSKKDLSELSNISISDIRGTESKTLCSLGEENGMMQHNVVKEQNQCNEGISPNIESNHHEQQQHDNVNTLYGLDEHAEESLQMLDVKADESNEENNMPLQNDIREAECNSSAARFAECVEQKGDFSDDLVNAMKRIESRILAFQLCSKLVDSSKNGAVGHPLHKVANLGSPEMPREDNAARSQLCSNRSLLEGYMIKNHQTDKSSSKVEKLSSKNAVDEPFLARSESSSPNQVANQNCGFHTNTESAKNVDIPKHIDTQSVSRGEELRSGTRIQTSAQNMVMIDRVKSLNRLVSSNSHMKNQTSECIQGLRVPLNQDGLIEKPSNFAHQTNKESLVRKTPVPAWSKTDQNQNEMGSESSHAQKKLVRSTPNVPRREKPPSHQMVIKPTLLDQKSSEIKVNSHQHRDWPVLDRTGTHKTSHVDLSKTKARVRPQLHKQEESSSSSSSNSDSSSHWTSQQDSVNTNSESEDSLSVGTQGPKLGRIVDASDEGNSEKSSDSYLNKENGPSHRVQSLKSYEYHSKRNSKKTIGGLKKLKNKLGLIFHHHHHHHHHHHDDNDNGNIQSYKGPRHSMWNHLQNVFHHKNNHGMITNKKDEKTRRGAITKVLPHRNQVGQFHRLVEGLLRHIRHSKKPTPSSKHGLVKGSKNVEHGHRQKKQHRWQIIPRRRRGVKLKNKGLVKKMGFMSQKSIKY